MMSILLYTTLYTTAKQYTSWPFVGKKDKTIGYGTASIFSEDLPTSSNGAFCTYNETSKGSKFKCHLEGNTASYILPEAYMNIIDMNSAEDTKVVAAIHRSSELNNYQMTQHQINKDSDDLSVINYELVSNVLSCSVYRNLTVRSAEVKFSIKLGQKFTSEDEETNFIKKNALCAFWDSNRNTWSTWGCERDFDNNSPLYIACNCNHTTSFAIIAPMEKYNPLGMKAIGIRVPTYTASLVSIVVQMAVIWHIIKLRKLVKDYDYVFALCNLLAASIATTATLVCSIEFSRFLIPCTISGIVMHFFYTATLAWLATEGAHYYLKIKGKTIEEGYTNKRYYSAFGWALPAVIVGIFVGVHRGYGKHDRCLLTAYGGILPAFIFSAVLFLTVKFILLVVAMRGYKEDSRTVKHKNVFVKIRRCVVESVFVIPYLGIIWVFGMTSHICYGLQVLFYILFALQGLVLSIYCYFTKEIELARSRSTRQGLSRLRSLSNREREFGRVPLEEISSPTQASNQMELAELKDEFIVKEDDEKENNCPTSTTDCPESSDYQLLSPNVIDAHEADDVKVGLLKGLDTEVAPSQINNIQSDEESSFENTSHLT